MALDNDSDEVKLLYKLYSKLIYDLMIALNFLVL